MVECTNTNRVPQTHAKERVVLLTRIDVPGRKFSKLFTKDRLDFAHDRSVPKLRTLTELLPNLTLLHTATGFKRSKQPVFPVRRRPRSSNLHSFHGRTLFRRQEQLAVVSRQHRRPITRIVLEQVGRCCAVRSMASWRGREHTLPAFAFATGIAVLVGSTLVTVAPRSTNSPRPARLIRGTRQHRVRDFVLLDGPRVAEHDSIDL